MTTKKNYYVCLRFKSRPKIHMILRYLKDLTPNELAAVTELISRFVDVEQADRFTPIFRLEAWYGPQHTVRVLEATSTQLWPEWLLLFLAVLPCGDNTYKYHPHVKCQDPILRQEVIAISLMCKKTEVARWDL